MAGLFLAQDVDVTGLVAVTTIACRADVSQ